MNDYFRLDEDPGTGIAELVLNRPERMNTMAPAHARRLAASIAAKSPLAIATTKLALNHARDHSTADSLQQMTLLQSAAFDIEEMGRAITAWKAKQPGEFDALR